MCADRVGEVDMPVSDQWRLRENAAVGGRVEAQSAASQVETGGSWTTDGGGPLSAGRRTKDLAGFWASQNDEVKVSRRKRLEAVETPTSETVVESVPRRVDGALRADEEKGKMPSDVEPGRTHNVASAFHHHHQQQQHQQQQQGTVGRDDVAMDDDDAGRRAKRAAAHTMSDTSAVRRPPAQSRDAVLNRSSATVVLAENDPAQLNPDVVRSSGASSWDDVTELEAGRTRSLLQHWKSTEQDAALPKTSTTRYQQTLTQRF